MTARKVEIERLRTELDMAEDNYRITLERALSVSTNSTLTPGEQLVAVRRALRDALAGPKDAS